MLANYTLGITFYLIIILNDMSGEMFFYLQVLSKNSNNEIHSCNIN